MIEATKQRALRALVVLILLPSSLLKFVGAPLSLHVFSTLGVEPWGRYLTASLELASCVLLLWPRAHALGALLASGILVGAIGSHVTRLGLVVQGDYGLTFTSALVALTASLTLLVSQLRRTASARELA